MNALLYDAAKYTFWGVFGTIWRMRVYGGENVPKTGPVIVACNHVSYFDPPLLGTACPRRIRYMAKEELFRVPVLGPAIRAVGAYPVDRQGSATAAIKRSVEVLREGGVIGIFPEGGRNLTGAAQARGGVALLASLGKAPVVPARLMGTGSAKRLEQFRVFFGRPLSLPQDRKASREDMANFTDEVMRAIRSLPAQQ
ncbi:MAG TPA: lysophospholipid acyltransferase family protein [Candidatus Baltobacteraceae bacterium]|nr:lysophospholipid acyltransferase family protein [Candidatus Baltobacteraceae bacterium]